MAKMKSNISVFVGALLFLSMHGGTRCQQDSSGDELYSETPCELRPLSAFKDVQSNLWGIGDGNVWWFNSTNLSWSLLPFPNGTSVAETWRVACGDPKRYVALLSPSLTLVLHLPWQHWQQVDADDVHSSGIDSLATWCKSGVLYATDISKNNIYILDHEEARWTSLSEATDLAETNISDSSPTTGAISHTWSLPDGDFILIESQESCDHIMISNSSASGWSLLKKRSKDELWPDLQGQLVTWSQDNNGSTLWLWRTHNTSSLWSFDMAEKKWQNRSNGAQLPKFEDVLTTWVEGDHLCHLERTEKCSAQYSSSATVCWNPLENNNFETTTKEPDLSEDTTLSPVSESTEIPPPTVIPRMITPDLTKTMIISAHTVINKHSLLSALQSEIDDPDNSDDIPITAVVPARHNPWHQHTSVFGSVIFFGTSLTIFGVVGSFWCMRKCVHFPKEALLLRDPPSVRYTAIPDNLPFDRHGHHTTAYTVIPDSIA